MSDKSWVNPESEEFRFAEVKTLLCSHCGKMLVDNSNIIVVWKNSLQLFHSKCVSICKKSLWPDDVI